MKIISAITTLVFLFQVRTFAQYNTTDTFYVFDYTLISSSEKLYQGGITVFFTDSDSLTLKADRKKKMFDFMDPYFDGVQVIVPKGDMPQKIKVRVYEKYKGTEIYCDTLLTLTKTKRQPSSWYFHIENRGLYKPSNPCINLIAVNTDQMKRPIRNEFFAGFEGFYSWRYDYTDGSLIKYLPY